MIRITKGLIGILGTMIVAGSLSARSGWWVATPSDDDTVIVLADQDTSNITRGEDGEVQMKYLPGEIRDTSWVAGDTVREGNFDAHIHLLARSYGDSIVLRWAAEDYVSWRYLNRVGVNILRTCWDDKDMTTDTLALALKPATLEEWRTLYPETDSIAGMAMGALYGEGHVTQDQSKHGTGTFGAMLDVYDDQQMTFAVAVLASEWRRDVAERLAMRFVDKNVKKGKEYEYIVQPTEFDSTQHLIFRTGYIPRIKNERYVPEKFDVEIGDSLVGINSIYLWWENKDAYSTYEIDRRKKGETRWTRVNEHPFLMMQDLRGDEVDCHTQELLPEPGDYEYRIFAHDAFGDLTEPSHIHTVHVRDIDPPSAPDITFIEIERTDTTTFEGQVKAHIYFRKDSMEQDLVGYKPLYYKRTDEGGKWVELVQDLIPVGDTLCVADVTGLPTGQIVMAAYDTAHNVGYSMPRIIRITDLKAPEAPKNFRYEVLKNDEGTIRLMWDAPSEDVDYYEIVYANDTTHEFMQLKTIDKDSLLLRNTEWIDTVALDVNQKYIYYKVRAVDYATNEGAYTAPLQVIRPSLIIPGEAHIDSVWVDQTKGINMRWVCSDEEQISHHVLMRRLAGGKQQWDIIRRFDADSVRAAGNVVEICDVPEYNRENRYEYAMESFSFAGISSGLSLVYSVLFEGDAVFEWPIKLYGSYNESTGETRLAWETESNLPYKGDWYFCIYRKGADDKRAKFLMSAEPGERSFNDFLLQPGEEAEYYIFIQYKDGRKCTPSNSVVVKAPKKSGE